MESNSNQTISPQLLQCPIADDANVCVTILAILLRSSNCIGPKGASSRDWFCRPLNFDRIVGTRTPFPMHDAFQLICIANYLTYF